MKKQLECGLGKKRERKLIQCTRKSTSCFTDNGITSSLHGSLKNLSKSYSIK